MRNGNPFVVGRRVDRWSDLNDRVTIDVIDGCVSHVAILLTDAAQAAKRRMNDAFLTRHDTLRLFATPATEWIRDYWRQWRDEIASSWARRRPKEDVMCSPGLRRGEFDSDDAFSDRPGGWPDVSAEKLVAMVAHELRQPLSVLLAGVQVLEECRDPRIAERTRRTLRRQVGHLLRILDDLLDTFRIRHARMSLHCMRLDARAVVEHAADAIRPLVAQHGQRLDVVVPRDPVWLDADSGRLVQILSNLLTNAVKHTSAGQRVWVEVAREPAGVVLIVGDRGDGIPAEVLPQIFDMFRRGPDNQPGGFGVGLAVVKQLAELHGGMVRAFSDGRGRGSRFVVTLPPAKIAALGSGTTT